MLTLDVGYIFVLIVSVKLCANGRNNFQKCWELLANNVTSVCTGLKVWPVSNFAQQHTTTWNRVCKRTQHVTSTCTIWLFFNDVNKNTKRLLANEFYLTPSSSLCFLPTINKAPIVLSVQAAELKLGNKLSGSITHLILDWALRHAILG